MVAGCLADHVHCIEYYELSPIQHVVAGCLADLSWIISGVSSPAGMEVRPLGVTRLSGE